MIQNDVAVVMGFGGVGMGGGLVWSVVERRV